MRIPPELVTVARHLGHLKEKTVFVGGMICGLLITDPAAGAARPTDDVDLIVDVPSILDAPYYCARSWKPSPPAAMGTICTAISKISLPSSTADRR